MQKYEIIVKVHFGEIYVRSETSDGGGEKRKEKKEKEI